MVWTCFCCCLSRRHTIAKSYYHYYYHYYYYYYYYYYYCYYYHIIINNGATARALAKLHRFIRTKQKTENPSSRKILVVTWCPYVRTQTPGRPGYEHAKCSGIKLKIWTFLHFRKIIQTWKNKEKSRSKSKKTAFLHFFLFSFSFYNLYVSFALSAQMERLCGKAANALSWLNLRRPKTRRNPGGQRAEIIIFLISSTCEYLM